MAELTVTAELTAADPPRRRHPISPWSFSSFNCVARVSFFTKFYLSLFVPLACAPVAALVVFLVQAGRRTGGLLAAVRQMGRGRLAGATEGEPPRGRRRKWRRRRRTGACGARG